MRQPSGNAEFRSDALGRQFAGAHGVLHEAIRARAFPGCAFGVLAGGETVLVDSLGRFTYDESAPPVKGDTVFDVASLTKVVRATYGGGNAPFPAWRARSGDTFVCVIARVCCRAACRRSRTIGNDSASFGSQFGAAGLCRLFRETRDARVLIQALLKTPMVTAQRHFEPNIPTPASLCWGWRWRRIWANRLSNGCNGRCTGHLD